MERISSSKETAEQKLIILYTLKKIGIPVDSIHLTEYILEQRLLSYVLFEQRIHELIPVGYVTRERSGDKTLYSITDAGDELLLAMTGLVPETEKNRVDRTASALRRRTLNSSAITAEYGARTVDADYTPDDERAGTVKLALSERGLCAIKIELAVSKKEARAITARWKENASSTYTQIYALLASMD